MNCSNCGCEIPSGVKFCPNCGTKVVPVEPLNDNQRQKDIDYWIAVNQDKLPVMHIQDLKRKLMALSDDKFDRIKYTQLNDPTIILIVSIFFGMLGVDRFLLGDTGLGLGKLFTCGGLYIWWLIDIFQIQAAAKEKNFQKLMLQINY